MSQARTLSDQEFELLLDHVRLSKHADRNIMMLKLLHYAGMRVGEGASLKFHDVVNADRSIRDQIILAPNQTKGNRSRIVWFNNKLKIDLADYLQQTKQSEFLFTTQKRDHFTANTLQAVITKLYVDARFYGCSSHSGRRSFITKLASAGVSARVLQELAGHRNLTTTQRYIDVTDNMKKLAVEIA